MRYVGRTALRAAMECLLEYGSHGDRFLNSLPTYFVLKRRSIAEMAWFIDVRFLIIQRLTPTPDSIYGRRSLVLTHYRRDNLPD